jgi:hypothetical protein
MKPYVIAAGTGRGTALPEAAEGSDLKAYTCIFKGLNLQEKFYKDEV